MQTTREDENPLESVSQGLHLLTLSLDRKTTIANNCSRMLGAHVAELNKIDLATFRPTVANKKRVMDIFDFIASATNFAATRFSFESQNTKEALALLEKGGPFLSDVIDFQDENSRIEVVDLIAKAEFAGHSIESLIDEIQAARDAIEELGHVAEDACIFGAGLTKSTVKLNEVLDDMTALYNQHWLAFKDIIDGLKASLGEETFEKPDMVSAEDFTDEEWEALEDADDLAIGLERLADTDRSQWVPAGAVRAGTHRELAQ